MITLPLGQVNLPGDGSYHKEKLISLLRLPQKERFLARIKEERDFAPLSNLGYNPSLIFYFTVGNPTASH